VQYVATGYIAVLLLRTDLSQIMAEFTLGEPREAASIMIADIVPWLEAPAQQQNQHALYIRGFCYQYGIHWEMNGPEGLAYIRRAADMGHASAQCKLGFAYNSGTDIEQDRAIAFEYVSFFCDMTTL
jgi:TPR repeat protein